MQYGIIGNGFVGKATRMILPADTLVYDICPELCIPEGLSFTQVACCDIVFICVPTPSLPCGRCDTSIVEQVITNLRQYNADIYIVVRSTVPIGFCNFMQVSFFPEFLTERNWERDVREANVWAIGLLPQHESLTNEFIDILSLGPNTNHNAQVLFVTTEEAEMMKYARNAFLALKVGFANELSTMCNSLGLSWDNMRQLIGSDKRIGKSHLLVPGPDGRFGFGGTCLPKDCSSLQTQMRDMNVQSPILDALILRNNTIDRPN
jgi:UDPglucose 6-dehydrogenase